MRLEKGVMGRKAIASLALMIAIFGLTMAAPSSLPAAAQAALPTSQGQTLVVVNKLGDTINFFDAANSRLKGSLKLPANPHEIVIASDGRTAYVSIYGDGIYGNNTHPGHQIAVLDLASRQVTGMIDISPYQAPHGLAFDAQGNLWATCDKSNAVIVVDPKQRRVIGAVPTGTHGTHWIVMSPDGRTAYTSNKDTDYLCVIDTVSRRVTRSIPAADGTEGICLSPDGTLLYAFSHMGSGLPQAVTPAALLVFNTATGSLQRRVPLLKLGTIDFFADHEGRVRVSPDGRYILVAAFNWNKAVVLPADLSAQKMLEAGAGPMGFAFPPDAPGHAYVANSNAGTISIIDLSSATIIGTFASGDVPGTGPETMEFFAARK